MVTILSDFVVGLRLKKKIKSNINQKKEKIQKFNSMAVLIPIELELDFRLFSEFAKTFKIPIEKITIVVFSKKQIEMSNSVKVELVNCSRESVGVWGKLPNTLDSFLSKKFDLLINYFTHDSLLAAWVSACTDSRLKMGFYESNHELNDLIIDVRPFEPELFLKESSIYLNALLK